MMKKLLFISILAASISACHHEGHEGHDHEHAHGEIAESHEEGKEPDGVVMLHDEIAERFGVKVDSVSMTQISGSLRSAATISRAAGSEGVVSAPTSGTVHYLVNVGQSVSAGASVAGVNPSAVSGGDRNRVAKAALDAAQAEVDRLKPLYEERLVTASEYQAAVAALAQARAEYSPQAASGRAAAPISGTITELLASEGAYVEAGTPLATVAADGRLTLTAQTAAENYALLRDVKDIRVTTSDGRTMLLSSLGGKNGGVSATGGYATVTFTFNNDGTLAPGSTVEAWLITSGGEEGIALPLTAITEQQGEYFVYREVMPEHYIKVPVKLGASDGEKVKIISGVKEGDRIVTSGVITVRLAESSGAIPSGHNHSH